MTRARAARILAAGIAIALCAMTTGSPGAAAGTGDNKLRVVQHNTDMGGYQSALSNATSWGDVDAVTFQELCEAQKLELEAAGWQVHWVAQREDNPACGAANGGTRKGPAIATKRGMDKSTAFSKWLGTYNDRAFFLICARITQSGIAKSWVCTTHLYLDGSEGGTGGAIRSEQTATIANVLDGWITTDNRRVVLTGDFNALPSSGEMANLYRVQAGGTDTDKFWEGDQADSKFCNDLCRNMADTTDTGRKLDYFFVSHRGVDPRTGMDKSVVPSATSGHHIVRGEATFGALT